MISEIKSLVENFFDKLTIDYETIDVVKQEENIYNVIIKTGESGLIIGPHGKNLDAMQIILKLMCQKLVGERIKIHIEVNDYQKSKDDRLFDFIHSKVNQVKHNKKDYCLPFYSAYNRKKIHGYISELNDSSIYTKSMGEGNQRRLHICFQERKLEIDIDGDDI